MATSPSLSIEQEVASKAYSPTVTHVRVSSDESLTDCSPNIQPKQISIDTFREQSAARREARRNQISGEAGHGSDTTIVSGEGVEHSSDNISLKSVSSSDLPADQEEVTPQTPRIEQGNTRVEYGFITTTPPQQFRPPSRVAVKKTFSVRGWGFDLDTCMEIDLIWGDMVSTPPDIKIRPQAVWQVSIVGYYVSRYLKGQILNVTRCRPHPI